MKRQRYRNRSLDRLLGELGISQVAFAREVGASRHTVQSWMTRKDKGMTWWWALRIQSFTGADARDLMTGTGQLRLSSDWAGALGRLPDASFTREDYDIISNLPEPCRARILVRALSDIIVHFTLVFFAAARAEERHRTGKVRNFCQSMLQHCWELSKTLKLDAHTCELLANPDWWNPNDGMAAFVRSKTAEIFYERNFYNRKVQSLLPQSGFYNDMRHVVMVDSVVYPGGWARFSNTGTKRPGNGKSAAARRLEAQIARETDAHREAVVGHQ